LVTLNRLEGTFAMPTDASHIVEEYSATKQALDEISAIYADAPIGLGVIGADMRFQRINARLAEINGVPPELHIGRTIREVVPQIADVAEDLVRRIVATGEAVRNFEIEGETPAQPNVKRSWTEHWTPIRDANGRVTAVNVAVEETTHLKQTLRALGASEARFAAALKAGRLGAFEYVFGSPAVYKWDALIRDLWGVAAEEEMTDDLYWRAVHPDDRPKVEAAWDAIFHAPGSYHHSCEYRLIDPKDGQTRWVKVDGDVVYQGGQPARMVGLLQDITERKRREEQNRMLSREVHHRSKNLLSVVQSIARQTARTDDPQIFAQRFSERLSGLAASHDLLVQNHWLAVDLAELIFSQLSHYHDIIESRIFVKGPAVALSASAAQTLGMAFHELATNAAKYGALSDGQGRVSVSWNVVQTDGTRVFKLQWIESGGPTVHEPRSRGLGTIVTTQMVEQSLAATVAATYAAAGLEWRLSLPLANLAEGDPARDPSKS
jgi:PAS domain S-box-containing protein